MAIDIERVKDYAKIGINGGAFCGPLGTAAPDELDTAPAAPWQPIGRISDDGLELGIDEDSEEFKAWGETTPFRKVITSSSRTIQFTAWETDRPVVRALFYRLDPATLVPDADGQVSFADSAQAAPDRRSFIFYVMDGGNLERMYCPDAEVTDRDSVTYKQDELVAMQMTLTLYPDSAGNTKYHVSKGYVPVTSGNGSGNGETEASTLAAPRSTGSASGSTGSTGGSSTGSTSGSTAA